MSAIEITPRQEVDSQTLLDLFKGDTPATIVDMSEPLSIDLGDEK